MFMTADQVGYEQVVTANDTGHQLLITNLHNFYQNDGHEWMEFIKQLGYEPIPVWGVEGWAIGDWPLCIYAVKKYTREDGSPYWSFASYVEGDVEVKAFAGRWALMKTISRAAFEWWHFNECGPEDLPESSPLVPKEYRQPYQGKEL